ncbi:MAG: imelysin family protein [Bacteroidota bacterium]
MRKIVSFIFLSLLLGFTGCDSDDGGTTPPEETNFDRAPLLANWADNIIIPAYTDFATSLQTLEQAVTDFNNDPTIDNLNTLRGSWLSSYTIWQRVSMFETGPAETVNLRLNLNIYPADAGLIEDNILAGSYNLDLPSNRVAKGFPALDYLLFGLGADDTSILAKYQNSEGQGHRDYLVAIITDMLLLTNEVKTEWETGYRDTFVSNSGSSATASVDRYVNDFIFYYEKHLRAGKMGIPLGVFSGNVLPENIEAYYNGNVSKQLFLEGLNAVQDFFNGKAYNSNSEGESLKSYLNTLNTVKDGVDLSTIINNQLNEARSRVQNLQSFKLELENNPPTAMLQAYDEVQKVVPLLKVDMVSAMSISIDFVDADGD